MTDTQTKANILIVDDTLPNLQILSGILKKNDFRVRGVPNGPAALKTARLHPPDLILLDIMMPGMNGYQVCQELKADQRTQDIPIIFISALGEVEDKINAFKMGGVDYIVKPFKSTEVLARVETHLSIRNLQKQLQQANASLKASNKELNAFAHTVAHNLKSPLVHVVGFSDILASEVAAQETSNELFLELAMKIQRGAFLATHIIDELLLFANIRQSEVQMMVKPVNMANVMAEVKLRLAYQIEESQAKLIQPVNWPLILGYGPWLKEVWVNYISNGIKYGGQPPQLELGYDPPVENRVRFWVRDNGPGLTPAEQALLFTEFTRLSERNVKGHGLGLSIVHRIVEKLGGQVGVESEPGQGSVFYFTLPLTQA